MTATNSTTSTHFDAIVVGARCAGAATAMLLARAGRRVVVVDRARRGADTLSTHALMRGGVLQLHRWGVLPAIAAAGTPAVRRTAFVYGDDEIEVPIKARDGVDALYSPRRTVLDATLADAAAAAGAELRYGVRVVDLVRDGAGRVAGIVIEDGERRETIRGELVIGADGRHSTVARLVDATVLASGRHASGVVFGYFGGTDWDANRWYFRPGVGAGVIPTNHGQACIFAATTAARYQDEIRGDLATGFRRLLGECLPWLESTVAAAIPAGGLRGFAGATGFLRQASGPGWALVGDAGYFKDPITAHGITDALRDAELLARAIIAGDDPAGAAYQATRDELARPFLALTDAIAAYDWSLEEVREMHLALSLEMNRELELVRSFDQPSARRAAA